MKIQKELVGDGVSVSGKFYIGMRLMTFLPGKPALKQLVGFFLQPRKLHTHTR